MPDLIITDDLVYHCAEAALRRQGVGRVTGSRLASIAASSGHMGHAEPSQP